MEVGGDGMIKFKIKDMVDKKGISRYKLQQLTNWNYKRVNAYYLGKVVSINVEELNKFCEIFNCKISDLIEYFKD